MPTLCLLVSLLLSLFAPAAWAQAPSVPSQLSFVRYQRSEPAQLETAIVTYRGPEGQTLDLISVVHIAERDYYQELNRRLKDYDAVLYELILPESMAGRPLPASMNQKGGLSSVQSLLGNSLGLATQLSVIDYSPTHFVHADLTQEALARSMAANQESLFSIFGKILTDSQGNDRPINLGVSDQELAQLDLWAVMAGRPQPRDRKTLKKLMATALTQPEGLSALQDTTLLKGRNQTALEVLQRELQRGHRRLALLYGAAHMPDFDSQLRRLGWHKTQTEWMKAWSI